MYWRPRNAAMPVAELAYTRPKQPTDLTDERLTEHTDKLMTKDWNGQTGKAAGQLMKLLWYSAADWLECSQCNAFRRVREYGFEVPLGSRAMVPLLGFFQDIGFFNLTFLFLCRLRHCCHSLGFLPRSWVLFIRPWDMGFFHEDFGFFLSFFKSPWVFPGFFTFHQKMHFFQWFLPKSKELVVAFCSFDENRVNN